MLSIQLSHRDGEEFLQDPHVLCVSNSGSQHSNPDPRCLHVPLPSFAGPREVWRTQARVSTGKSDHITFARTENLLHGSLRLEVRPHNLAAATYFAYQTVLRFIKDQDLPLLWRVWNFVPLINHGTDDQENYRLFCLGRHDAFIHNGYAVESFPAATAIGCTGTLMHINFFASSESAKNLENPRQVSAYRYPRKYGPRGPSFARASHLPNGLLLVSGTAAVLGHESQHIGDWKAQLREIQRNLKALLGNERSERMPAAMRVYVRDGLPVSEIAKASCELWGADLQFFVGDICRQELLIEVDGVWS